MSFGKEKRECGKQLNLTLEPGRNFLFISAGQYAQRSLFESSVKSCKGFSLGIKTVTKDLEKKPGPGNYDPDFKKIYSSNPSFSIPRKYKPANPDNIPAPNAVILVLTQYDVKVSHTSVHMPFAKAKRQPFLNNKDVPGPGEYQPLKLLKSSPKFSLGISRKNDVAEDFPGPGTYQPNKNVVKSRPQSAKIGRSVRCN